MCISVEISHTVRLSASSINKHAHEHSASCETQRVYARCVFWLITTVLCFALAGFPSSLHAAPIIQLNGNADSVSLAGHTDVLSAKDIPSLSANAIANQYADAFSPINLQNLSSMNGFGDVIWLRFAIHNHAERPRTLWLINNDTDDIGVQAYQRTKDTLEPVYGNTILGTNFKELQLEPNSTRLFLVRVERQSHQAPDLEVKTPASYLYEEIIAANEFGLALGMLLMIAISSAFLMFYYRARVFLFLCVYSKSCIAGLLFASGFMAYWWPHIVPWEHLIVLSFIYLANAALILLVQTYLMHLTQLYTRAFPFKLALAISGAGYLFFAFRYDYYSSFLWLPIVVTTIILVREFFRAWLRENDTTTLMICLVQTASAVFFTIYVFTTPDILSLGQLLEPSAALAISIHASLILAMMLVHYRTYTERQVQHDQFIAINNARSKAQTVLLSEISHDLRTPVAGILGMADLMMNDELTPKQKQLVEAISQAGQALLNNVAEISDRLQLQQSEQVLQKAAFELPLLVDEITQAYRLQAEERNIELIVNIQPELPTIVEGDATRLRQILQQLIKNAVIYTSQGEVVISVILLDGTQGEILFCVRDSGRGLSPQEQQGLLDNSEQSTAGNGLYIVKQHLKTFHSSLELYSKMGEGSEFSFTLRLPIVATAQDEEKERDVNRLLSGKRLLIVDDNHTCSKVLKQQASSWGMQATASFDATEALALFRAQKNLGEAYDAVVVDYDMPHHSGLEVAEKMLKETDQPPIIVMLTGLSIMPPEHITKQAGIQAVLNKPASQKLVRLTLANLFAMHNNEPLEPEEKKRSIDLKVLIAEDNDFSRRVISKMMQTLNVSHKLVSDGQLAVDAIKKETFDLVLMDCEMPVMNGFDATREIRIWQKSRGQQATTIIALSAHVLDEHKQHCREVGMNDFLEKPIKLTELETLLRDYQDSIEASR